MGPEAVAVCDTLACMKHSFDHDSAVPIAEIIHVWAMIATDAFQAFKGDHKYSCDPFVLLLANYPPQVRWQHGFTITLGIIPGNRYIKVR